MRTRSGAKAPDIGPRPAPARPGPLDFPQYQVQGDLSAAHQHAQTLDQLFLGLEKNVSAQHVEALNITLLEERTLDLLVPEGYLPPSTWLQDPSLATESSEKGQDEAASNQKARGYEHESFYQRARELLLRNDDCFDSLPGKPGARRPPPVKLSHANKFYQNLLFMAEFWDTSKDNYETKEDGKELYTGRRYGGGHEMPSHYREDTVGAFVELCVWPFRCNLQNPRSSVSRKLQFRKQYYPIQSISSAVCRNPTDRQKARKGILEGPLIGIHCRNTTTFRTASDAKGEGKEEIISLLFEVGGALLIAQKRAREGKEEEKPWQDRFWALAGKRHLGEMGGGRQDLETNASARREIEATKSGVEPMDDVETDQKDHDSDGKESKKRRIQGPKQAYLATKPPESQWESKMEYCAIGKAPGAGYDNIYLISSLNHHISLVHIRIDDRYLDFITHGPAQADFDPSTQEWWSLEVQRSKWFDLLDPDDRGEAMRGVWGVMRWMMRDVVGGG
ncbi:MAG: hypothetical protein LQ349_006235 [Xanthoria aureola]|nr:MAG: hypothetical protein LQ349_006235 [Xanthoria aureola]